MRGDGVVAQARCFQCSRKWHQKSSVELRYGMCCSKCEVTVLVGFLCERRMFFFIAVCSACSRCAQDRSSDCVDGEPSGFPGPRGSEAWDS